MKQLLKQYLNERHVQQLEIYQISSWDRPSEVVCCKKGIYVFIKESSNREVMYRDLCEVLKGVV